MKELEYPFDCGYIMKKRKSIKKELLSDGSKRIKKKIAVLGGSTTSDIITAMELFLLNNGIECEFYESEYARYWQDAVFGNEELDNFKPDVVYIHTSLRNLAEKPNPKMSKEEIDNALENEYERFSAMWKAIEEKFHCPIIQNNFEMPLYRLMGNREASDFHGVINFATRMNMKFYERSQQSTDFYINDINYLSATYGLDKWLDPMFWYVYKYSLCVPAIPLLSHQVANIIKSIFGKNKKALCLDLDNTMWGGIVGDDGVENLEIGQETATAQAFYEFQEYVKAQKDIGVLLTVCSKNDYENAEAGLSHPDGAVKPDDFVVIKANWNPKDLNITDTASELNILPESMVFVDDNPAEREIVRSQLINVICPEVKEVETYIRTVDRSGFFEVTSFSDDDLKRNDMYKANAQRKSAVGKFASYKDYLLSLEMQGEICDFKPLYIQRITQLTNKSNQFNVTTKRYSVPQMEEIFNDDSYIRLYGKLADKFGDNGVVSVVIGKKEGKNLNIDLWLMSCRVLKRDMEFAMLDELVKESAQQGIEKIYGYYYPTAKNKMVAELYKEFGFNLISADENGDTVWELEVNSYESKNNVIKIN